MGELPKRVEQCKRGRLKCCDGVKGSYMRDESATVVGSVAVNEGLLGEGEKSLQYGDEKKEERTFQSQIKNDTQIGLKVWWGGERGRSGCRDEVQRESFCFQDRCLVDKKQECAQKRSEEGRGCSCGGEGDGFGSCQNRNGMLLIGEGKRGLERCCPSMGHVGRGQSGGKPTKA